MRRHWRTGAIIFSAWLLVALYSAALTVYRTSFMPKPWSWSSALQSELTYAYLGALLTPLVIWLARRYPVARQSWIGPLAIHFFASAVFAMVLKMHWDLMVPMSRERFFTGGVTLERILRSISYGFDTGFIFYCLIVLIVWLTDYYRRYQRSQIEAAELQTQLVQAQLRALRAQLDPHFLFNALHSISELVHSDPEGAERMIASLSELLRRSLETSARAEVPLREELGFLQLFLDIEKVRFEERLNVRQAIDPQAESALVPNLVLQPLVENAIRHGLSKRVSGGWIRIGASIDAGCLVLTVTDNGPSQNGDMTEGVGLSTVRGRLERLYGAEQSFQLRRLTEGVEAKIVIPFRPTEQPVAQEAYAAAN
ncbi:MAG: histidine kinase [Bryobacteraceae bacterium]